MQYKKKPLTNAVKKKMPRTKPLKLKSGTNVGKKKSQAVTLGNNVGN